jgi:aspartate racemase
MNVRPPVPPALPHRIGLIGGIGWPSTADYYRRLNVAAQRRRGGLHGADLVIRSLDFAGVLGAADTPGAVEAAFLAAAADLHAAGARVLGLCSVTGHLFSAGLDRVAGLAFVDALGSTADALAAARVTQAHVLATRRTLDQPQLRTALQARGIRARDVGRAAGELLDRAIFEELERGLVGPLTLAALDAVEQDLRRAGATELLLACTELPPALQQRPIAGVRVWDCVQLHVDALCAAAFGEMSPRRPEAGPTGELP